MAFIDENGRITIDEAAANADIQRIMEAQEILQTSRTALKSLIENAGLCVGETPDAIIEKGTEIQSSLNKLDQNLTDTIDFIKRVVEIYREKDRMLRALMESGD